MGESRPPARLIVATLPAPGETVRIGGAEAAHGRARRLTAGERVILVDGSGVEAEAAVARVGRGFLEARIESAREVAVAGPAVTLAVAGVRPERLDWIAEKATELGVARLVLVAADRSQAFRASADGAARLERIVREAAKQCGAARWPEVLGPVSVARALADPADHRFVLDIEGGPFPERLAPRSAVLLVGPEGGFTAAERAAALAAGWSAARLPPGRLRTETAAVAGLALLLAAMERRADSPGD